MQPIELFSNFFLTTQAQNCAAAKTIFLENHTLPDALKEALAARYDLQTVYVCSPNISRLKSFLNGLIIEVGKVDFGEVKEIRLMNDCIFLP